MSHGTGPGLPNERNNCMRKRRIIKNWIIAALLTIGVLFSVVGCIRFVFEGAQYPGLNVRADLVVDGEMVPDKRLRIYQQGDNYYGDIPILAVLRQLGYQAEWVDDETARIIINGESYEYRRDEEGIFRLGTDENLCMNGFDGRAYSVFTEYDDIYMPTYCFLPTMENLGVNIEIEFDIKERKIIISGDNQYSG